VSSNKFDFLKQPIPCSEDGVSCIVVHKKAKSEIGRLMCVTAITPFFILGRINPHTDLGEYESFYDSMKQYGNPNIAKWVTDYHVLGQDTPLLTPEKSIVEGWYLEKIKQNWYVYESFMAMRLPFLFAYEEIGKDKNGNDAYIPMNGYSFLVHAIRNYKADEVNKRAGRPAKKESDMRFNKRNIR